MAALKDLTVCITGASAGIGAACAAAFAAEGSRLLLAARRKDRIDTIAARLAERHGVATRTAHLDVRNRDAVDQMFASLPEEWSGIDVLVNNAGLSRGLDKLYEGKLQDWEEMIDTNVKGLLYVTRAVLPGMVRRDRGHVINIGSVAGHATYPGGNVYCASKFAVTALGRALKMDLLGTHVRVSSVDPGLVQTEFSEVRFRGDSERAGKVYADTVPLRPEDVAEAVVWCATRPPHVNINELVLMPVYQASVTMVHRPG